MHAIEPGDLLLRAKGPVMHKGVAMSDGRVFHNTPQRGEHTSTLKDFSVGKTVKVVKSPANNRGTILNRLSSAMLTPRKYSYTGYNCDHSSSSIIFGKASSPQLVACTLISGVLLYQLLKK